MPAALLKTAETEPAASALSPQAALVVSDALTRHEENALELCEAMIDIAAALFNVSSKEIRSPRKTTLAVSRVRQIGMYVAHVTLCLTMGEVGRGFGRDRTTVQHACQSVEDLRDDPDFDRLVGKTEEIAAIALRHRVGG